MKFSEKFKKNKSEAVETETAQDFGKMKLHRKDLKRKSINQIRKNW